MYINIRRLFNAKATLVDNIDEAIYPIAEAYESSYFFYKDIGLKVTVNVWL